jgi:hypothetical protein
MATKLVADKRETKGARRRRQTERHQGELGGFCLLTLRSLTAKRYTKDLKPMII